MTFNPRGREPGDQGYIHTNPGVRRPKLNIRSTRRVNTATRDTRLQQTAERAIYSTRLVESTHGVYKNRIPLAVTVLIHRVLPPTNCKLCTALEVTTPAG